MKIVSSWGLRLLGAYLLLVGIPVFVKLPMDGIGYIQAAVAIAAGVCLLIGR